MNVRVGEVASTGNTSATQIVVTDKRADIIGQAVTHFIKVESGTVKFSIGSAPAAGNKAWASTDTIPPITCNIGELYCQQTAAGDTFIVH